MQPAPRSDTRNPPSGLAITFTHGAGGRIVTVTRGKVTLSLQQSGGLDLAICFKGSPDHRFFKRAAPGLERFLKHPQASLTLRIEAFKAAHMSQLQELLRKLARYGDRVCIEVDERLRTLVPIDSSVFHLVLAGRRD